MIVLLWNGLLLSLDSFLVSLACGLLITSSVQRWRLAALFGGCDSLAVLAGSVLGFGGWAADLAQKLVPIYVLACGVCCLAASQWNRYRVHPRVAFALPVIMSFDNFLYGAMSGPLGNGLLGHAMVLGAMSFILAAAGLFLWEVIPFAGTRIRERYAGWALVIACVGQFFT